MAQPFEFTHQLLFQVANPATFDNPEENLILARKLLTCVNQYQAQGISAPEVGVNCRLFVIKVGALPCFCFNPEIVEISPENIEQSETCLSFPGETVTTRRSRHVVARFQNYRGQWVEARFHGAASVRFQHELDHLQGLVMHDRAVDLV
jgi:peptide deformylase